MEQTELPSVEACTQLFAAVVRDAIRQARLGFEPAAQWLDDTFPEWERYGTPAKTRGAGRKSKLWLERQELSG